MLLFLEGNFVTELQIFLKESRVWEQGDDKNVRTLIEGREDGGGNGESSSGVVKLRPFKSHFISCKEWQESAMEMLRFGS